MTAKFKPRKRTPGHMAGAGGSQEFYIAWELAKDVLDKVRKP